VPATPAPGFAWAGARNSAAADGAGCFDRTAARRFVEAVPHHERKYIVELNARAFLPEPGRENVAAALGKDGGAHVAYLQFRDHPDANQRREVAARGVELLSYCTGYAWVARGTAAAFENACGLDFVRAVASVDARDRMHPLVFRGVTPPYAQAADGRTRFVLLAQPGTTPAAVAGELARTPALAGLRAQPATPSVLGPRFEVVAPAAVARVLAALDSAAFLSLVPPPAASRDATTDRSSNISAVRDNPPSLTGAGVKVAVREVGRMDPHTDFATRLTYMDNNGDTFSSAINHATGVTGQIGSSGVAQPTAKGVAPGVTMLAYALTNDTFDVTDVVDAARQGARLSNHSYGPADLFVWGDYDTLSADWDAALRSNDLVAVFASNEETGGLYKHIDFLVGAKNTICVTATTAAANAGDGAGVVRSNGIASFVEFGPMNDGRVKPDLAAFGDNVTLVRGSSDVQTNSGTSFSAPAVTGVAALAQEYYKTVVGREPSAPLMKALLCNAAADLGLRGPDAIYGFGIVDAKEAVATIAKRQAPTLTPFVEDVITNGGSKSFTVSLQGAAQLKVTLCWFDPAGSPSAAKALVNDLDLAVEAPDGTPHYPFSLSADTPSLPATNTGANTVDPIEQIIVDAPADGTWTVRVLGTSIFDGPQAFAVCLNQAAVPPPLLAAITASPSSGPAPLTVLFSAADSLGQPTNYTWTFGDGGALEGAGLVQVEHTYAAAGSYTATVMLDGASSASTVVYVSKREVAATPGKLRARLSFRGSDAEADDSVSFALQVAEFVMSSTQAREALKSRVFEGRRFAIKLGGSADGTTGATKVGDVILNDRASFTSPELSFRLNPVKGEIRATLRRTALEGAFAASGMTRFAGSTGVHDFPVELETPDAVYRAVFTVEYKTTLSGGAAKR
jgi:hypothetical protein